MISISKHNKANAEPIPKLSNPMGAKTITKLEIVETNIINPKKPEPKPNAIIHINRPENSKTTPRELPFKRSDLSHISTLFGAANTAFWDV